MLKFDREQALARAAIELMSESGVAPTPGNFEIFFLHTAGESAPISQAITKTRAEKKPFTPELLQNLRTLAHADAPAIEQLGDGIDSIIADVLRRLSDAGRDAGEYSSTLSAATGALGTDRSLADTRQLINNLLAATRQMEKRGKSLELELQKSSTQVHELRSTLDNVRKETLIDPLTAIGNRKAFDAALGAAEKQAECGEVISLLICDIDHFKKFNDTWGHQTGDLVLKVVAGCLSENIKGRDLAARYGGEEFALVLRGAALEGAIQVAEQIRRSVEGHRLVKQSTGDVVGNITVSIGVAEFGPREQAEAVVRRADACLYGAKRNGRNLVIAENDPRMKEAAVDAA
ncbi:MAG TPA: GGDEF domain-containing protein [Rhizomicrobium sp.]|nr:GGDEF domain-containing protein [Rhizomicrobium sp.]